MRVLIGCEESGKVRDAFNRCGHNAYSNDIIPARNGGPHILKCVKRAIVEDGPWDIIILHPDCTKLSLSGNRWYGRGMPLHHLRQEAIYWTGDLWNIAKANCRIGCALENPTSVIWKHLNAKVQFIQPHYFGHGETKKTGLALYNLPQLQPTNEVSGRFPRVWLMPPGINRKRDRSETYTGIADAMALQWGGMLAANDNNQMESAVA